MYTIFDGNGMALRTWFGMPKHVRESDDAEGLYLYCFLDQMLKVAKAVEKQYPNATSNKIMICWDTPTGSKRRKAIYPEYKKRKPRDESERNPMEVVAILPLLFEEISPRHCIGDPDYEADDLIAYLVHYAYSQDETQVVIVSRDADLYQLLEYDEVCIHDPFSGDWKDQNWFIAEYGFTPEYWALCKAVMGDSSDNWPGVNRVGPKKATAMMKDYYSKKLDCDRARAELENLFGHTITLGMRLVNLPFDTDYKHSDKLLSVIDSPYPAMSLDVWQQILDEWNIQQLRADDLDRFLT